MNVVRPGHDVDIKVKLSFQIEIVLQAPPHGTALTLTLNNTCVRMAAVSTSNPVLVSAIRRMDLDQRTALTQ